MWTLGHPDGDRAVIAARILGSLRSREASPTLREAVTADRDPFLAVEALRSLLTQRSRWVDEGGKWGVPGGAIRDGESPEMAARRETTEEVGTPPSYRVTGIQSQDCGGSWIFHTISADVEDPFEAFCGQETDATGWFTREEMRSLPLHPGLQMWLDP